MQILSYILKFGMAWFSLTCPFSSDWKKSVSAHALSDVNADKMNIIDGAGWRKGGCSGYRGRAGTSP